MLRAARRLEPDGEISVKRIFALAMLMLAAAAACAQERYPAKPVQVIVPFAAGTGTDFVARLIAERLAQKLGQPFVVQNRAGASGTIATDSVAKAQPDGYTLLIVNSLHSTNPAMHKNLPYDSLRDFAGIAKFAEAPSILVVHPKLGVRTLKEFIAHVRQNPGKINYGTSGIGSNTHFGAAFFIARTNLDMVAVHYKGAEIMADIIAGRIEFLVAPVASLLSAIREGRLVALGVTSREPLTSPIEVDTVERAAELPGYEYGTYYGFLVPAKTPRRIIDQLSTEIRQAVTEKDVRDKLAAQATFPRNLGPAEFDAFIRADMEKTVGLLKTLGVKTE